MPTDLTNSSLPETPAKKGFSVLALVSTLTGALSYLLILFHSLLNMKFALALFLAPISALAAIITGHRSHRQIKASAGTLSGKKLSRAGLVLGYLYFAISILLIVLAVALFGGPVHGLTSLFGSLGIQ